MYKLTKLNFNVNIFVKKKLLIGNNLHKIITRSILN